MKFAKDGDKEDLSDNISFASDVQLKPYMNQIPVYRNLSIYIGTGFYIIGALPL